jgi:hypothetical protein
MSKIVRMSPSTFTENHLTVNGKPFSFLHYEFMKPIYDVSASTIVLKSSRQVSKSTTLANLMVSRSAMFPHFHQLYVSPSSDQTKIFSNDRVSPVLDNSSFIKKHYISSALSQNVFTKKLKNGSVMYLRYALQSPDRLRGISSDSNLYDECQDQSEDNIAIINQSMSRSMFKRLYFTGTPKRTKGTLANVWYRSTMMEWMPKCTGCNKHNFLDHNNIGLTGPICRYCGKYLDTRQGQWVITGDPESTTVGFRVNILMFAFAPWVNWKRDVIETRANSTSDAAFFNEVLGLEYDEGVQPVTLADLKRACSNDSMQGVIGEEVIKKDIKVSLGIDYGPVNSTKSKTVICALSKHSGKYKFHWLKKFTGHESDYAYIHSQVPSYFVKWRATLLGADAGLGDGPNAEIRARLGDPERLIAFRYSGNQKAMGKWNKEGQEYVISRNQVMTEFFQLIKKGQVEFPRWSEFEPFAQDILNIVIEYDKLMGSYKFVNDGPDDALHAMIFAYMAYKLIENMEL